MLKTSLDSRKRCSINLILCAELAGLHIAAHFTTPFLVHTSSQSLTQSKCGRRSVHEEVRGKK